MPGAYRHGVAAWQQWPHNLTFKPLGRRPVRGGRWSIRKAPGYERERQRSWRAWTYGKAQKHSRWFKTQAEAVEWANYVAELYYLGTKETADKIIGERRQRERVAQIEKNQAEASKNFRKP